MTEVAHQQDSPPAKQRGQETIRDMILSLGVVMLGVAIFVLFVLPRGSDESAVKVVDTAGPLAAFAQQASYPPLGPAGLPAYWKPTSIRLTVPDDTTGGRGIAEATIGYVVDRNHHRTYARFLESNAPDAVQKLLGNRPASGTVDVDGVPWQRRLDADGHLALTRSDGGITVIADDGAGRGSANQVDLVTLAQSLRPVTPAPSH